MATNRMLCVLWNWDASIPMPYRTSCACDSAFFNRACAVQPGRARAGRWHPCIQPDARDATTGSTRASNRMRAMLPTLHRQTAVSVGSARPPLPGWWMG